MVAVITNGTAILGLGNLGALAAKPVMEGKAVLFKRFADVDSIDLEIETEDPDEFISAVKYLGPSFGGINLEDIKAPECFFIEERLREMMDIPVFHDDQHGTAIIAAAGMINAIHLTGRDIKSTRLVCNGAGAAGIACLDLIKAIGFEPSNVMLCDTKGVVYRGRTEGMNQWKSAHAVDTPLRTLDQAMVGADIFFGLSAKGALTPRDGQEHGRQSDHFRDGQPGSGNHAGRGEEGARRRHHRHRPVRLSQPGQQRPRLSLHFPRRARRARQDDQHGDEDRGAHALADLAREDVPDEVAAAYQGARPRFGRDYIIPVPFDPRLIHVVPIAVAKAAMDSGVAQRPIVDMDAYKAQLSARRDPIAGAMQRIIERVRRLPKRVVFAEGEEEQVIRAAYSFVNQGLGTAILVGTRGARARPRRRGAGLDLAEKGIEIHNARLSQRNSLYAQFLYERLQRSGYLFRDCQRMINQDRNYFAAAMVAQGDADAMVTGVTRNFSIALEEVRRVIDDKPGHRVIGVSLVLSRGRPVVVADTAITEMPTAEDLAEIAIEAAGVARRLGYEPRVAMLAFSNFGHPPGRAHAARAGGGPHSRLQAPGLRI